MPVHWVFVAKYRRNVFNKTHLDDMRLIFTAVCEHFEAQWVECDGEQDHVHLLVTYPPKLSVSTLQATCCGRSLIQCTRSIGKGDVGCQVTLPEMGVELPLK